MMKVNCFACILVQLSAWTLSLPIEDLTKQILSIVEDLRSKNPDTFSCLLYLPRSNFYADLVVQRLLTSSTFADIPVLQLERHFVDPTVLRSIRESSLVIFLLDSPVEVRSLIYICKLTSKRSFVLAGRSVQKFSAKTKLRRGISMDDAVAV